MTQEPEGPFYYRLAMYGKSRRIYQHNPRRYAYFEEGSGPSLLVSHDSFNDLNRKTVSDHKASDYVNGHGSADAIWTAVEKYCNATDAHIKYLLIDDDTGTPCPMHAITGWRTLPIGTWLDFCRAIPERLPGLTRVKVVCVGDTSRTLDSFRCMPLFGNLPRTLNTLEIERYFKYVPHVFDTITPLRFPLLTVLSIRGGHRCYKALPDYPPDQRGLEMVDIEGFKRVCERFPNLRKLSITRLPYRTEQACIGGRQMLVAMVSNDSVLTQLEDVDISMGDICRGSVPLIDTPFPRGSLPAMLLQYHPSLNYACHGALLQSGYDVEYVIGVASRLRQFERLSDTSAFPALYKVMRALLGPIAKDLSPSCAASEGPGCLVGKKRKRRGESCV